MRRARQRGHAMIELAISAGLMVTCLGGTFEFGYTFYVYNQLVTAVGNGGRYAALRSYRAATPEDLEKGKAAIQNMVVYGDSRPAPDTVPLVINLKPEQVKVDWIPGDDGAPSAVNVSIIDYNVDAVFGKFDFKGRPGVEFPFVGRYAPMEHEP